MVEFMVTLLILNIILGLAYSYYWFGTRSFEIGSRQYNVQQNVRLATDYINNEVRYAKSLEILASKPTSFIDGFEYIYVNENSLIEHVSIENGVVNIEQILPYISGGITYAPMAFKSRDNVLSIKIAGNDAGQDYDIETDVLLLNMIKILGAVEGIAIKYSKTPSIIRVELTPEHSLVGVAQDIGIRVLTSSVASGTKVTAEFVNHDKSEVEAGYLLIDQGAIASDSVDMSIYLNDLLPAGFYKVKVKVQNIIDPVYMSYVIGAPAIDLVELTPTSHNEGVAQDIQIRVITRYVADDTPVHAVLLDENGNIIIAADNDDTIQIEETGSVYDNLALLTISVPDSLELGEYSIRVIVEGVDMPRDTLYSII